MATALVPALGFDFGFATASLGNFERVWPNPAVRRAFANSLALSLGAAAISAVVAIALGWLSLTVRNPLARALSWMSDAGFVVPEQELR